MRTQAATTMPTTASAATVGELVCPPSCTDMEELAIATRGSGRVSLEPPQRSPLAASTPTSYETRPVWAEDAQAQSEDAQAEYSRFHPSRVGRWAGGHLPRNLTVY